MVALLWSMGLALAQVPGFPGLPAGLEGLSLSQGPKAEARWLVDRVAATRFPGEETPGPVFEKGELVELVTTDGERSRVRQGDRYGWVPSTALTIEEPPPPPADPMADLVGGSLLAPPQTP